MHNSVKVPELLRWRALRDQIVTIAQDLVAATAKEAQEYATPFLDI
jgi:hypothetical protein